MLIVTGHQSSVNGEEDQFLPNDHWLAANDGGFRHLSPLADIHTESVFFQISQNKQLFPNHSRSLESLIPKTGIKPNG